MNTIEPFLVVFAIGGLLCGVTWLLARKLIHRSWHWRAAFCILLGATIAPTVFYFWSGWVIYPAVLMLFVVSDGGKQGLLALLLGGVPILLTATLIFATWSIIILRNHKHESHVA
jgi:membrane-anchored protein YejM (alkaline phosphatase superfamily)